jgi:hypothetical protein
MTRMPKAPWFLISAGTTEVMWVEQRGGKRNSWLDLAGGGVVTISEQFGGGIEVTAQSFLPWSYCGRFGIRGPVHKLKGSVRCLRICSEPRER